MKQITSGKDALEKMVRGVDIATAAVGGTLGPKGRNVFIDHPFLPEISNDGSTIAQNIVLEDKLENAGAYIIKNASSQTNDVVGDGTTTTAVLTHAIIHECLKRPENPMEIMRSLKEAGVSAIELLEKNSTKIKKSDIKRIALISAENEPIAQMITEIIETLGNDATINVEDSRTFETEYEIVEGYEAQAGLCSPHFINDKNGKAIFTDISILVSEKRISNVQDLAPLFNQFERHQIGQCVFVCDDIDDSIIGMLAVNKQFGKFSPLVIKTNGDTLNDIAGVTGARVVSDKTGLNFQNILLEDLGRSKKIISDKQRTLFITDKTQALMYASALENEAKEEPNMFLKKKLQDRIAKLSGNVAVLKVGAPTDFERTYLRRKAEDAVKAVPAAIAEGVSEGGGMALWKVANELKGATIGEQILKKALKSPLKRIIENGGGDIETMPTIPEDVIDPTKVERCAIEHAVSAASIFITTETIITDIPEKK